MFKRRFSSVIDLPQKNIAAFSQYLNLAPKPGVLLVTSLEISNGNLDITTKDFNVRGVVSSRVNVIGKIVDYLDMSIYSLGMKGLEINNVSFKTAQGSSDGRFGISRIKYNKLTISDMKSQVQLSGKELLLENVYAKAFDGTIGGNLKLKMDRDFSYDALMKVTNFDIASFINDFDLKEKFEMTGTLKGEVVVKGNGAFLEILTGKLSSLESGGSLIIKDTRFLENMARNTNQSKDLLVENFKDYHYTIGAIKLFLDKGNLNLDIALDGETGKRNITIVLHDFILKKEGI